VPQRRQGGCWRGSEADVVAFPVVSSSPLKRHRTTGCQRWGHQELYFDAAASVPDEVVTFLSISLAESVEKGTKLQPGEFARLGWHRLKIIAGENDMLTLLQPRWTGERLEWIPDLTTALETWLAQRRVLESVGIPLRQAYEPPRRAYIYTCGLSAASDKHLLYHCQGDDGGASFWQYMCRDAAHICTNQEPIALPFEPFAFRYPQLVHFLALPAGISVDLDRDGLSERFSDGERAFAARPGSYLDRLEQERRGRLTQR
jgi:hypothetical protein